MREIFWGGILIFSLAVHGANKKAVLNPFQKNIQTCLQDQVDVKKLNSLPQIYKYISDKYFLLSSEILGREVLYKIKNESRKLKFENGKVQLFKVLEAEDDQLVPIDNEVRQRSLTSEAYLAQLLLHADIRSDWMKLSENRSDSTVVVVTTLNGKMKSLHVEKTQAKKKLECLMTDRAESCSCGDLN